MASDNASQAYIAEVSRRFQAAVGQYPQLGRLETEEDLLIYLKTHPETGAAFPNVYSDYETLNSYLLGAAEKYQETPSAPGDFSSFAGADMASLLSIPLLFYKGQEELMEDATGYQKIRNQLKEKWFKENNVQDFNSEKGLDYLYGSLDDPAKPSLDDETEKLFREKYPKKTKAFDKKREKIYKNPQDDPAVLRTERQIKEEVAARTKFLKSQKTEPNEEALIKKVSEKRWLKFAHQYEKKAAEYSREQDETTPQGLRKGYQAKENQAFSEELAKQGKDLKFTEKTHPPVHSGVKIEEASRRLEEINQKRKESTLPDESPLVSSRGKPISSATVGERKEEERKKSQLDLSRIKKILEEERKIPQKPTGQLVNKGWFNRVFKQQRMPSLRQLNLGGARAPLNRSFNAFTRGGINSLNRGAQAARTGAQMAKTATRVAQVLTRIPPQAWVVIIAIVLIIIVIVFIVSLAGGQKGNVSPSGHTQIPGLSIALAGPSSVNNGQDIVYVATITYDQSQATIPLNTITIYDPLPDKTGFLRATGNYSWNADTRTVSWPLSDPNNQSRFTITLKPLENDILVLNRLFAATTYTPLTGAPGGASSGNACTAQWEGSNYCSYEYLKTFFGTDGNKALTASLICEAESGSDPFTLNPKCPDYSVGLFQINLIAHCAGAYGQPYSQCILLDPNKRNACQTQYSNPDENIMEAVRLSGNGTTWGAWSTWSIRGKNPPVRDILSSCGIM